MRPHHFDPSFMGIRECNNCGDDFKIEDLSSDLLCENCDVTRCAICGELIHTKDLIKDKYLGEICEGCADWIQNSREEYREFKMENHLMHT
jgi:predicted RNA-binding Zn-ribbon protein involved in translation (DUF1610 family)